MATRNSPTPAKFAAVVFFIFFSGQENRLGRDSYLAPMRCRIPILPRGKEFPCVTVRERILARAWPYIPRFIGPKLDYGALDRRDSFLIRAYRASRSGVPMTDCFVANRGLRTRAQHFERRKHAPTTPSAGSAVVRNAGDCFRATYSRLSAMHQRCDTIGGAYDHAGPHVVDGLPKRRDGLLPPDALRHNAP